MQPKMLTLLTYCVLGLLLAGLSIPMIQEKVKPNLFYGFRTRKTLSSPDIWFKANRYAGWRLLWMGLVSGVTALLLYLVPGLSASTYALACTVLMIIGLTITLAQSFAYLAGL